MKVVVITGYKPSELGVFSEKNPAVTYIKQAIRKRLVPLVEAGLEWVIISGQLGVELWAAQVVVDIQLEHPHLQLGLFTPFLEQEENWNEHNKMMYEEVLIHADHVDSITKRKYENPMQFRLKNSFLVDKSDGMIIMYDSEHEASPKYILAEAMKKKERAEYEIMTITFADIQDIVEEEQWNRWEE
ncbi:DUF1273 domain-containing protein [Priestia taiwanensis]|uniref:UPF0398 protein GCM10007140_03750 n=1 Tax=Priestia taiwanensis TaxID=1347902 RepID=A0A917AIY5_9BACI|nr:DUF1273 domain-containing protein [Priestia taiwanensis]MBM7361748.1 putative phage-like protein YoqJ [Priestia taiwanensis]GGE56680.1 UPF0398 protein [Priestia taiwanensis]